MAYYVSQFDAGKPSNRFLLVPSALVAMLLILPFIVHWRTISSYGAPPAAQRFDGLLVAGNLRDALAAGFTYCIDFNVTLRCRRNGLMLLGFGPFDAAVDLAGGDGRGGFNQLILWHKGSQDVPVDVSQYLENHGWASCITARGNWGDQHIFMRKGAPVRISIDISYYGRRRIRVIPEWNRGGPACGTASS